MKKIFLLSILIIFLGSFVLSLRKNTNNRQDFLVLESDEQPIIPLNEMFYGEENFIEANNLVEKIAEEDDIHLIVVPHHLLASEYISKLIKMSSGREIRTVVIIGPNHNNIGSSSISTVKARWYTPFGFVKTQDELVDNFVAESGAELNYQAFTNEHSVGAISPFVKYYLPRAEIVPIIYSSYAGVGEAMKVSQWLENYLPDESLIIISTDFSHYLTKQQADQNDKIMRQLILESDIEQIAVLNNDYIDSPISLVTALIYAEQNNLQPEIIDNSNSFDFSIVKPTETTSYFAIVWR